MILIIAALMGPGITAVYPQDDSTRYFFGLPVSDDDTVDQIVERDMMPKENLQAVPFRKLPVKVREALLNEDQYHGGQDSTIFFDKNTRLFVVYVESEDGMQVFGLNENGKPVTFNAVSRPE